MRSIPILAAVAAALLWPPSSTRAQAAPAAGDVHLLVAVQGAVTLRRSSWSTATPTGPGAALHRGDLVSVPRQGRATVACADLTLHDLPAGRFSGIPCSVPKQAGLVYEGSLLAATRGDETDDAPFVIAPRRTKLLSPRPVLRWSVPREGGSVTVAVRGPGVTWSTQPPAGSTSLNYPADAPGLQAGVSYRVTVTAGARSSDEAAEPGSGFSLVSGTAADEARAGIDRIGALRLGADAERLLVAHFLASRGFVAEAIEQLEAAAPAARPLLTLGNLYQSVGLARLAEARNLQAAKAAEAAGDIEAQAQAQLALGTLYLEIFGLREDAARAYAAAAALLAKLGEGAAADRAREKAADAKGS